MPQKALLGGIGAVGSAMARFFHPSEKIRDTWPQDDKRRVKGVLVVDEGIRKIRHKDHKRTSERANKRTSEQANE
jgi:prephenate dehydrogenase